MTRDEVVQAGASVKAPAERRLLYIILGLMVVFMGLMVWSSLGVYNAVKDTAQKGKDLADDVRAACEDPTVEVPPEINCGDAKQLIEEAPSAAQGDPGDQGEKGDPGEPGPPPSSSQVALAVASYCAGERCDGRNATQAQVSSAVALYCDDRGQCRGPVGVQGEGGDDGQQGPPPSDSQVASAVADYCSTRNDCKGPAGETGDPGAPGVPGDVVTGGSCEYSGVGKLTVTIDTATGPTVFECTGSGVGPPVEPGNGGQ